MRSTPTTVRDDLTTIPVSSTLRLNYLQSCDCGLPTAGCTQPFAVGSPQSAVTLGSFPPRCTSCHVTTSSSRSFSHKPEADCYDAVGCSLYAAPDTDERIAIMVPTTSPTTAVSRRGFLRGATLGIGGAALGGLLTACSTTSSAAAPSG